MTVTTEAVTLLGELANAEVRKKQRRCRNNGGVVGLIGGVIGMLIDGLPVTGTAAPLVFWSIWGAFTLVVVLLCVLVGGAVGWYVGKTKRPILYFVLINYAINMATAGVVKELTKHHAQLTITDARTKFAAIFHRDCAHYSLSSKHCYCIVERTLEAIPAEELVSHAAEYESVNTMPASTKVWIKRAMDAC